METEQLSMEVPLSQGKNKEIKDLQELNEHRKYPKFWETMKVVLASALFGREVAGRSLAFHSS